MRTRRPLGHAARLALALGFAAAAYGCGAPETTPPAPDLKNASPNARYDGADYPKTPAEAKP